MSLDRITAPFAHTPDKIELDFPDHTKLDNGISFYHYHDPELEVLKLEFEYAAGLTHATKSLQSTFTNELIASGTSSLSQKEIADKIDFYGAYFQQNQTWDHASVVVFTLRKYAEEVLKIIAEVLHDCSFPESEVDNLRQIKRQKFLIDSEKVGVLARRAFQPLLYGEGHAYSKKVKVEDYDVLMRKDLTSYYQYYYQAPTIYGAGHIDSGLIKTINQLFGQKQHTPSEKRLNIEASAENPSELYIERKDALQSAIRIGRPMFTRTHADYAQMQVLLTTLGGYFGSRLMSNLREDKGFTYGINAGLSPLLKQGHLLITTQVGSEVTNLAVEEIFFELKKLQDELIPEGELETVKNYMLGQILRATDGVFQRMERFKNLHHFGLGVEDFQNYISEIRNSNSEKLNKLAQKWLGKEELFTVVAGKK